MLQGFEHVGMTSGDLDRTIWFYCELLGLRLHLRKPQPSGEVAFLDAGGGMLEIFAPVASIERSRDIPPHEAGMRHMTFAFSDIDRVVQRLEDEGIEILERPRLAHNQDMFKRVAFCRDPDGIIVELAERAASRQ
jgi:glyoxylase I family protein